ncbi:unnamed protein product [Gulo gulo]|uniref:Uncharacterized protein n=1 Tax=Gulo gulo TaxID=48420 RepID=A0A9X9M5W2_GULGU|nr:unnamed protein product [Gulo gulo]
MRGSRRKVGNALPPFKEQSAPSQARHSIGPVHFLLLYGEEKPRGARLDAE